MPVQSNNKTIAKNTIFLYFRMFVTMIISLYTSRVVLQTLGVDDYGIYQAVGGIVGLLGFINGALATGSSRFLTYTMGEGDAEKLKRVFSTTLTAHIILALLIVAIAETVGLWYLYNKMVIPAERMSAAVFAYHVSIVTAFFTITQVPYGASIIAHEKMSIYAYVSIAEAVLKLAIVFLLVIGEYDKLKLYALLLCLVQVGIILFYRLYCTKRFAEVSLRLAIDKTIFKDVASFSGWSLFANASIALNNQGVLLLLNFFFSPAVVAARSISIQVNNIVNQFVSNFQTAANPQIVKLYASGDYEESKRLLLQTTKVSYYMMFIMALPIVLTAEMLLHLWLGVVPEYATIFLQLVVVQSLFQVFDVSFYRALYAKGRIKENALISPMLGLIQFPVVYFLFNAGCSPVALSWASIVTYAILALVVKPFLVIKIANYKWVDIFSVFKPCIEVTIASIPIPIVVMFLLNDFCDMAVLSFVIIVVVSVLSVAVSTWFLGLNEGMKKMVKGFVASKNPCKKI
ncbi:MAG: polysaccharide biosynthesis protein [Bacteroidales bacterium]|nr:polysaccharide biosynthesis protein [Bacteroidales bacterium]